MAEEAWHPQAGKAEKEENQKYSRRSKDGKNNGGV